MMKTTKTGLRYYPKGSPEAKAHMARLRAMRGSKRNPLTRKESADVISGSRYALALSDRHGTQTRDDVHNKALLKGWGIGHAAAAAAYSESKGQKRQAAGIVLRGGNPAKRPFKRRVPKLREALDCEICGGLLVPLGKLGHLLHLRCRDCGMQTSREENPIVSDPRGAYRMESPVAVRPAHPGQAIDVHQYDGPAGTMLAVARDVNPPMLIMGNPGKVIGKVIKSGGWRGWYRTDVGFGKKLLPDFFVFVALSGDSHPKRLWKYWAVRGGTVVVEGFEKSDEEARSTVLGEVFNMYDDIDPRGHGPFLARPLPSMRRVNPSPDYGGPSARYVRYRQRSPLAFAPGSFRTIPLGRSGRKAVVGCPKGQWMPRRQRCRVGMRMQSILRPKRRLNPDGLPPRIANDPAFRRELREYRAIHGEGPVEVRVVTVPPGSPKYMTSWGHIPEIKYDAPSKKGKRIHKFGEHGGSRPYLVSSVARGPKYIGIVGGTVRIGRKRGSGPQKWLLR